jgi:hypothetical protein
MSTEGTSNYVIKANILVWGYTDTMDLIFS